MARRETSGTVARVAIALVPEHSLMVRTLLAELLRIAGLTGAAAFETVVCSPDGQPVISSNGRRVEVDAALADVVQPKAAIVCASYNPYDYLDRALIAWLRAMARRGVLIGALDIGTIVLAEAGLLDGRRATLHWDELDLARRRYPKVQFSGSLVEAAPDRLTGCGSLGTIEFALELIAALSRREVAEKVMDLTIHGRHETALERAAHPALSKAVKAMSENVETPLAIDAIARAAGLSTRQLTRRFDLEFDVSPGRYYLNLRLDRARELIAKTRFPLSEIAFSTGFNSMSWFSRAFKARFSISPSQARQTGQRL